MTIDRRTLLCAAAGLLTLPARADAPYPARPVRFILAQAAGSSVDLLTRLIGSKLSDWSLSSQSPQGGSVWPLILTTQPIGTVEHKNFVPSPIVSQTLIQENSFWHGALDYDILAQRAEERLKSSGLRPVTSV